MSKSLFNFAIKLAQDGAFHETLYEYKLAMDKYDSALFVLDELIRELYNTLHFSKEDRSTKRTETNEIRCFTFDITSSRVEFS